MYESDSFSIVLLLYGMNFEAQYLKTENGTQNADKTL